MSYGRWIRPVVAAWWQLLQSPVMIVPGIIPSERSERPTMTLGVRGHWWGTGSMAGSYGRWIRPVVAAWWQLLQSPVMIMPGIIFVSGHLLAPTRTGKAMAFDV